MLVMIADFSLVRHSDVLIIFALINPVSRMYENLQLLCFKMGCISIEIIVILNKLIVENCTGRIVLPMFTFPVIRKKSISSSP